MLTLMPKAPGPWLLAALLFVPAELTAQVRPDGVYMGGIFAGSLIGGGLREIDCRRWKRVSPPPADFDFAGAAIGAKG